jgi:hypothetical protein
MLFMKMKRNLNAPFTTSQTHPAPPFLFTNVSRNLSGHYKQALRNGLEITASGGGLLVES